MKVESRDTDNAGHKTQNDVKLNKNTTKKTKRISNTDPTTKKSFHYRVKIH